MSKPVRPPLLIYHTSFLPYLPFALWQNSKTHPDRQVILLGDRTNRCDGIDYVHQDVAEYQHENEKFIRVYRHAVDAHFQDERRCIERWFVLGEFLTKTGLESFYFLDSDYLLFEDLASQEREGIPRTPWGTPYLFGLSLIPDAKLVHRLCAWILDLYQSEPRFLAVKKELESEGWGMQEMGLILSFCREQGIQVENRTWQQSTTEACFDNGHFGSSYKHNRRVFDSLRQASAGGPVTGWDGKRRRRLSGLHFGGNNKSQIPGFTGWSPAVIRSFFRPNYRRNLKYLCQYLWNGSRCRSQLARSEPVPAKA